MQTGSICVPDDCRRSRQHRHGDRCGCEPLRRHIDKGVEVICLDSVTEGQLARSGQLIWEHRETGPFAVGSQGLEYALIAHWQASGQLAPAPEAPSAGPVKQMIVVSGSLSIVTQAQITWAENHGFEPIVLDAARLATAPEAAESAACAAALQALANGRDPLVLSARGPDDPAIRRQRDAANKANLSAEQANERIGQALGRVLARVLHETGIKRAAISGGDTSGYACQELGLFAFTALAPTIPGAALLEAHSEHGTFEGLQLALKGGQMGSEDYFGWIKRGGGDP